MGELMLVSRGDTFPRSFLDTYRRSTHADQLYSELKPSKSDELVLQATTLPATPPTTPTNIPGHLMQNCTEFLGQKKIHHGHSENHLLDSIYSGSGVGGGTTGVAVVGRTNDAAEDEEFLTDPDSLFMSTRECRKKGGFMGGGGSTAVEGNNSYQNSSGASWTVDPEDSIRDIVTGNDFYRFVLFKKHYDKYVHLAQKYDETRSIAYYLEEKYHEVKSERDGLLQERDRLSKRLESNEGLLRDKEDEVFLQFERVVHLEELCEKLKAEKERCLQQQFELEKEKDSVYRLIKLQAQESEGTRIKLEKARQEVVQHMTQIRHEKESLERENGQLKEALEAERKGIKKYMSQMKKKQTNDEFEESQLLDRQNAELSSNYQKALDHLSICKKCSVCSHSKPHRKHSRRYDRKLLGCLQTPFMEMRNMIKPPPSPINGGGCGEGESLSEWFCPAVYTNCSADRSTETPPNTRSECSSLSIPFAELAITYMDDTSSIASTSHQNVSLMLLAGRDDENTGTDLLEDGLSQRASHSTKGFGSDSGFSSDICGDYKSSSETTPKQKITSANELMLDEADCAKLRRTKWTSSFRKLIRRIKK